MAFDITYAAPLAAGTTAVLVPGGLSTPHGRMTGLSATGAQVAKTTEATTGQTAYVVTPETEVLQLTFHFDHVAGAYPQAMFTPHPSRFTRFADDLVAEAQETAGTLTGIDRARALACAAAERFTYGHPEDRFNDGLDEIPALGCGLVEGSCVDINTYFIAALRAAGIEAGYATGFYFPTEKGDTCTDGHCWVVTRIDGATQEWDIAHHLKMDTRDIHPGLNPKPGFRAACFHSMGLRFDDLGVVDAKALIEPVALVAGHPRTFDAPDIRLTHVGLRAAE